MGKAKRRDKNKAAKAAAQAGPQSPPGIKVWHLLAGLAVALFAVFEVYQPAINGPFLFDDKYLAFTHPEYQNMNLRGWLGGGRKKSANTQLVDNGGRYPDRAGHFEDNT